MMNENTVPVNVHMDHAASEKTPKKNEKDDEIQPMPLGKMSKTELIQKAEELQAEAGKNYDLYVRSQAEIENLKKRSQKEKEEWIKFSNESLIKQLLPVMDNLEKAIAHSENDDSLLPLRQGVELTLRGLQDTLTKAGLEVIRAQGEPFDPCFHQAVYQKEDDSVEAGINLQELQKGYTLNQRLIRPAMVVVSRGKPGNTYDIEENPEGEG
jgi:molecular chaperone GrpE